MSCQVISWLHLLELRPHILDVELDSLLCGQPWPVSRSLQGVQVKRQQLGGVVVGRPVLLPQLGLPQSVSLDTPASKVGMDRVQR